MRGKKKKKKLVMDIKSFTPEVSITSSVSKAAGPTDLRSWKPLGLKRSILEGYCTSMALGNVVIRNNPGNSKALPLSRN